MITCDQLIYIVRCEMPGLQHGRDFVAGHPLDAAGKQRSEPFFLEWRTKAIAQPEAAAMIALWPKHEAAFAADEARTRRDFLIARCDWTQAGDVPEATREKYRAYRQTLRDVPQQPGFPLDIDWPELPG
jgi:hypothetical protein